MPATDVVVTGGTGYIGRPLVAELIARKHRVRVIARLASTRRVPAGATAVVGDALDQASIASALRPGDTLVHLVGTPHPGPAKAKEFANVDLVSVRAAAAGARRAEVAHFVYVSVAQPAPVMRAYVAVRAEGEKTIAASGLTATLVRPWYVLGPGHWWPIVLLPGYALAEAIPAWRESARRLGLVSLAQMVDALVRAVEAPPPTGTQRVVEVPEIRR